MVNMLRCCVALVLSAGVNESRQKILTAEAEIFTNKRYDVNHQNWSLYKKM